MHYWTKISTRRGYGNKNTRFHQQRAWHIQHFILWKCSSIWEKDRNGIRPIVARFTSRRDLEYVLKCAYRLKGTDYGIKEQFPKEIELKRKELYPILKQAKKDNNKAVLVRDRLYINGELYKPQPNISNTQGREFRDSLIDRPTHSQIPVNSGPPVPPRPYKRSRINSDEIENTHL
ncbi:unnamed protein product [Mytilus edulis]|uniref:Uncharacterized protein n=1 Tax=Mytilus edulis TaxID=6550 RepID=A0A8S3QBC0_MYTED|nr:unnamed protein product [Mytilus edulis]